MFLKDLRTVDRSPLFPVEVLVLLFSWAIFSVVKERVGTQNNLVAIPLVVAYVLLCLQATVTELTANAFAGESDRLSLILTAPLSPGRTVRCKPIAHLVPTLLVSAVSAFVISMLVPLSLLVVGLTVLLACFITATNATLLMLETS